MAHVQAGAKKVVISAPAGKDLKTIVYSVNEKTLTTEDQVISAASYKIWLKYYFLKPACGKSVSAEE